MKHRIYDISEIARLIEKEILPDPTIEDWRKKGYQLISKGIRDTTCENIYNVHQPLKLAKMMRKEAKKFFELSKSYHHTSVDYRTDKLEKINFDEKISRIFLGIACELMLKAAFISRGYCIHKIRGKKFPFKFRQISKSDIFEDKTESFGSLIKNVSSVLDYSDTKAIDAFKGYLEIAKDWRNNDLHLGIRHWENASFRDSIICCFDILDSIVRLETR
jgi:hypothetical protein